jgi:hypothetical protein
MNTFVRLYLDQFFLQWEMFQTRLVEKVTKHIVCSITFFFFRKSCRFWNDVEKCGTARQATEDSIIRRMLFACWITKATHTYSERVILISFARQEWLRELPSMLHLHAHCLSCCIVGCAFADTKIILKCVLEKWGGRIWGWNNLAQNRDNWRDTVNIVMNLKFP